MIEYIRGTIDNLTLTQAVLEACGVGYALSISLNTYTAIQGKENAKLYVYESIRDDAFQLYGFATVKERDLFLLLINVPGFGGQTARMVLSAFLPEDLARLVQNGDERALKSVKGIGPKAAQRIIVDMKDKVMAYIGEEAGSVSTDQTAAIISSPVAEEAKQALSVLGFSPVPVHKVVSRILKDNPNAKVEEIIKSALKQL